MKSTDGAKYLKKTAVVSFEHRGELLDKNSKKCFYTNSLNFFALPGCTLNFSHPICSKVSIPDLGPFGHKHTPQSYSASFKDANHLQPQEQSGFPVLSVHPPSFLYFLADGLATRQQRLWIKSDISSCLLEQNIGHPNIMFFSLVNYAGIFNASCQITRKTGSLYSII